MGATMVVGAWPDRNLATSSGGRTVADRPMRWAGWSMSWSSRSSDSARWAPRLVAATAWTSSTITVSTSVSVSRAAEVSIRKSDSGVVMRMSGGLAIISRRRLGGVSPERTPTLMLGASLSAAFGDAADAGQRGAEVAFDVDRERLERGHVEHPGARLGCPVRARLAEASRSMAQRNAASVFPDPVGAMTRVLSPLAMASHASVWAAVGAANVPVNHSRVSSLKRASGAAGSAVLRAI